MPACREHNPHVALMDYRLPGLDGIEATRALKDSVPERCGRRAHRVREPRRDAGAAARPAPSRASRRIRSSRRSSRRFTTQPPREADGREHGDRARLDRRLPAGAGALRELADGAAVRPLRRREPARLRRDRPGGVLRAAANRNRVADDVAADAGRLPRDVRGARAYERIYSLQISAKLSGTFESARTAARELRRQGARRRHRDGVGRDRDARASRSSGGSSAARATRRSTSSSRASSATRASSSPSTRSSSCRRAGASARRPRSPATCCTSSRSSRSRTARCCR